MPNKHAIKSLILHRFNTLKNKYIAQTGEEVAGRFIKYKFVILQQKLNKIETWKNSVRKRIKVFLTCGRAQYAVAGVAEAWLMYAVNIDGLKHKAMSMMLIYIIVQIIWRNFVYFAMAIWLCLHWQKWYLKISQQNLEKFVNLKKNNNATKIL